MIFQETGELLITWCLVCIPHCCSAVISNIIVDTLWKFIFLLAMILCQTPSILLNSNKPFAVDLFKLVIHSRKVITRKFLIKFERAKATNGPSSGCDCSFWSLKLKNVHFHLQQNMNCSISPLSIYIFLVAKTQLLLM